MAVVDNCLDCNVYNATSHTFDLLFSLFFSFSFFLVCSPSLSPSLAGYRSRRKRIVVIVDAEPNQVTLFIYSRGFYDIL